MRLPISFSVTREQHPFFSCFHPFIQNQEAKPMRDPDTPKGAIALMLLYMLLLIALWANVYFTVLARGATL